MGVGCPSKGTPLPFWCSVRFPLIPLEFNDFAATPEPELSEREAIFFCVLLLLGSAFGLFSPPPLGRVY